MGRAASDGQFAWFERGICGLGVEADALRPPSVAEVLRRGAVAAPASAPEGAGAVAAAETSAGRGGFEGWRARGERG